MMRCERCETFEPLGTTRCPQCGYSMAYTPSPEEIQRQCEEIQQTWSDAGRARRDCSTQPAPIDVPKWHHTRCRKRVKWIPSE